MMIFVVTVGAQLLVGGPWAGFWPFRPIRKASLLVWGEKRDFTWALLGYAPQRLCPGVYCV